MWDMGRKGAMKGARFTEDNEGNEEIGFLPFVSFVPFCAIPPRDKTRSSVSEQARSSPVPQGRPIIAHRFSGGYGAV